MLTLSEIKKIIEDSGLSAQFRIDCKGQWSDFVKQEYNIPYVYTEHHVDYIDVHSHGFSGSSMDISLILYHDKKPCAVWPLMFDMTDIEPIKSINNQYGGIIIPPFFIENFPKKSQRSVVKNCLNFLNKLLGLSGGKCWRTSEVSTGGAIGQWYEIALEKGGMLDRVNYEMYVDLSMSIQEIRKCIRKSYRPLISSGLKKWKVLVMDQYCENTWKNFRLLHKTVAGRVTRPIETWNVQHEAIKSGNAFLVHISDKEGKMVGGGYFNMSSCEGNYSVGSYNKELSDQPLGHMIQYQAILTMKEKGRKQYYIGSRFYIPVLPFVTEKQVNISRFKAGFSTFLLPRVTLKLTNQRLQ